jgi:hypothetical protein
LKESRKRKGMEKGVERRRGENMRSRRTIKERKRETTFYPFKLGSISL